MDTVICNAIEAKYFDYLNWKKLQVFDSVIGPYQKAIGELAQNRLYSGRVLF